MNAFIRLLYAVLIAAAVVAFVATGMYSLYSPPKGPEFPMYTNTSYSETDSQKQFEDFGKRQEAFKPIQQAHYRKVSIAALVLAVLIVGGGLVLLKRMEVIGEGVALGGIGTSVYGAITAGIAQQKILLFLAMVVLLSGTLLLTHRKFMAVPVPAKKKR